MVENSSGRSLLVAGIFVFLAISLLSSTAFPLEFKYEGVEVEFKGKVAQVYTDNFTYDVDENKDNKFFTSLELELKADRKLKRQSFGISGRVNMWLNNYDFNNERVSETLSLRFEHKFSAYSSLNMTDSFTHTSFPVGFEEEFGRSDAKLDDYRNNFQLTYYRSIHKNISGTAGYSNDVYWSPDAEDSVGHGINLGLRYRHDATTSTNLLYSYRIRDYENSEDISIHSVKVGMRRYITKRIFLNGSIGMQLTSHDSETVSALLALHSLSDKTDTRLSFSKSFQTTTSGDVFDDWRIEGVIRRQILQNLKGYFSGFYGRGEYLSTDIEDRLYGIAGGAGYKLGKHWSLDFNYRYSKLTSTDDDREYTQNTVSGGIVFTF